MASPETLQPANTEVFIGSYAPTTNNNTEDRLRIGERNDQSGWIDRNLIKFNGLSDGTIPANATIISAVLSIYCLLDLSNNARTFRVYRQKRAWVASQCTWNIFSTGNNWQTAGGFGANDCEQTDIGNRAMSATEAVNEWKDFNLTPSAIQEIVSGAFANNGFLLKADTEENDGYQFAGIRYATASLRPKLVVTYTTSQIKSINGLAKANIKSINGLAIASIKSRNGLA